MALYPPSPSSKIPDPKGNDQGINAAVLARNYMLRQYWSLKWWWLTIVSGMSIYTISFERWLPLIGLSGLMSFFMILLGLMACGTLLRTEFLKAARAKQHGTDYDWTKVRHAAWGLMAGNLVMLYWGIVMVYITWFSDDSTSTLIQ